MVNPISNRRITRTLAGKLIIAIGLLIIIGGGISWYILLDNAKKNLISDTIKYTSAYSNLIKTGTRYSMLTFHRESIQQTIDGIGSAENIKRVRIFDSKGKIFYSSMHEEIGRMVNRKSPACKGCHLDPERPALSLNAENQWIIYTGKDGHRILTFAEPIYNEPSCYTATCHVHPADQRVLGIIETDFPLFPVDENIRKQTMWISVYALFFMGASFVILYYVLQKFVLVPVATLSNAMVKVSEGDLEQKALIDSGDEMNLLADTFNVMTNDLKAAKERSENWTKTLEEEVARKTKDLKKSQHKLIQAEKLASLGRLTSDVAHEIRNPLSAIGGFARRLNRIVSGEKEKEYSGIVVEEVNRLEKILKDVLNFSREAKVNLKSYRMEEVIKDTLKIYRALSEEQSINVRIEIGDELPDILIDLEQVRQALGNLIINAIDAMPDGGVLTVKAGTEGLYGVTFVYLGVSDTGIGISEAKLPLIFEPFFSTKEIGHGTGLGLSITRKIMEEHGGFVKAESKVGEGSTFSLYFPYQGPEECQKINCWEYMKCGREKDATIKCPAWPNFGRMCWAVAGTFCEGKVQGTFAQKFEDCKKCEFYLRRTKEEI